MPVLRRRHFHLYQKLKTEKIQRTMSKISHKKGCRKKIRLGKKAFIADAIVDFWSYILFLLVVIIFAFLYKWVASDAAEKLTSFKGVTWSNYLAETYLRTPINIEEVDMTMAELIALYDYNQTLYAESAEGRSQLTNWMGILGKTAVGLTSSPAASWLGSFDSKPRGNSFIEGESNILFEGIEDISDDYISDNFDAFNTCYIFMIRGNAFRYTRWGSLSKCRKISQTKLDLNFIFPTISTELKPENFMDILEKIPQEYYMTYIPPIDPRKKPVELIIVYDMDKILEIKRTGDSIMNR